MENAYKSDKVPIQLDKSCNGRRGIPLLPIFGFCSIALKEIVYGKKAERV